MNKHRKVRWTLTFLQFLMKAAIVNSWILFKQQNGTAITQTKFLESIALEIQEQYKKNKKKRKTRYPKIDLAHMPCRPSKEFASGKTRNDCYYCSKYQKIKSSTTYMCKECDVWLHPDCFKKYHDAPSIATKRNKNKD